MSLQPQDSGTAFATGFAFGLFGSVLGVGASVILDRDWVPGAIAGFLINTSVLLCLGVGDLLTPASVSPLTWMLLPEPSPEPIQQVEAVRDIPPSQLPAMAWALFAGLGIAVLGIGGALWMWLVQEGVESDGPDDPAAGPPLQ